MSNLKNKEGWTPAHFAGFLNNFDAMNLLLEHGADLSSKNSNQLTTYCEIIRNDNSDLFECIWPYAKKYKRDLNDVSWHSKDYLCPTSMQLSDKIITDFNQLQFRTALLASFISLLVSKALRYSLCCLKSAKSHQIRSVTTKTRQHHCTLQYWPKT